MNFCSQKLKTRILATFGFNRTALRATQPKLLRRQALKDNIREAIGEIQLHTIYNLLKNWTASVGDCMASLGRHLNEIIFHYEPEGLYFQIKKEI